MNQLARILFAAIFVLAAARTQPASAQEQKTAKKMVDQARAGGGGGDVERGKYIVESVAMCGRCHTPGGDMGTPDRAHTLQGAPIRNPEANWALYAPRLAGTPPGTDEQFVTLLTTGITRMGRPPNLPMPRFRMSPSDAASVLAYIKSLK